MISGVLSSSFADASISNKTSNPMDAIHPIVKSVKDIP